MSGGTNGISLTPPKQTWHGKPVSVQIKDIGSSPMRVTTSTVVLHKHCLTMPTPDAKVTPVAFTLKPGQTMTAHITVSPSPADYGVVFSGETLGAHSGGTVAGAVGSQVLSGGSVSCVPVTHHVASPTATGGFPLLWLVVGLLALVLAVVGTAMWRRRRA